MFGAVSLLPAGHAEVGGAPQAGTHPERQAILGTLAQATRLVSSSHVRTHKLTPSELAQMRAHIASLGAAVGQAEGA